MIASPTSSTGDGESPDTLPSVSVPSDALVSDGPAPANEKISLTEEVSTPNVAAPSASDASTDHIDQIRNILVGGLRRDTDVRFDELERRVMQQLADIRGDVSNRLDTLDARVREESEALARRI